MGDEVFFILAVIVPVFAEILDRSADLSGTSGSPLIAEIPCGHQN